MRAEGKGMKTIGLIGGMSWESTVTYYRIINEIVKERMGGFHSAKLLLYSVDFDIIEKCQAAGDWEATADILTDIAGRLEAAGADFLVLCTNTMHKVAPQIQAGIGIPLVHIADAAADALKSRGINRAALLGTKYTMTQDFYTSKLAGAGINVLIPDAEDVETVNSVIYNELCLGKVSGQSKRTFLRIIDGLAAQGAQGVILGCTEIGLLIGQEDTALPVFDTARIHAEKAAILAMEDLTD
jgi:aspartate racemase